MRLKFWNQKIIQKNLKKLEELLKLIKIKKNIKIFIFPNLHINFKNNKI